MKPKVLAAIVWGIIALWVLVANADFGSFRMDQPFLARSGVADPCADITIPYDDMQSYSNHVYLDGLAGGCNWPEAYVDHGRTNLPALFHWDSMSTYTDGEVLNGLIGWEAIAPWTNGAYVDHDRTNVTFQLLLASAKSRWVHTDLTNGEVIALWTNRIAGMPSFTNGNAAVRPTNSSVSGVWLDNAHYLTNVSMGGQSTLTWFFIAKVIQIAGADSKIFIDRATYEVGNYLTMDGSTIKYGLGYNGLKQYGGGVATNVLNDVMYHWNSGVTTRFYNNGAFSTSTANVGGVTWDGQRLNDPTAWINWFVKEIIIFTNILYLEEAYVLHNYKTNTY